MSVGVLHPPDSAVCPQFTCGTTHYLWKLHYHTPNMVWTTVRVQLRFSFRLITIAAPSRPGFQQKAEPIPSTADHTLLKTLAAQTQTV